MVLKSDGVCDRVSGQERKSIKNSIEYVVDGRSKVRKGRRDRKSLYLSTTVCVLCHLSNAVFKRSGAKRDPKRDPVKRRPVVRGPVMRSPVKVSSIVVTSSGRSIWLVLVGR